MLSQTDRTLLELIQKDLPLVSRPFSVLADACGLEESQVVDSINRYIAEGIVREVSAIFNTGPLGYKTTLMAAEVDPLLLEEVQSRISADGRVGHNYLREHTFNVWFTFSIRRDQDWNTEVSGLLFVPGVKRYLVLPAVKTFKIGVSFRLTGPAGNSSGAEHGTAPEEDGTFSGLDKKIVNMLQRKLEVVPRLWQQAAAELDIPEQKLLQSIAALKRRGVIKRISAVLRHRRLGVSANGMACFSVPSGEIDAAGRELSRYREVSHCYQRKTCTAWPYGLFAMVHAGDRETCEAVVEDMARRIGCSDYQVLYSTREFKKERVKYQLE